MIYVYALPVIAIAAILFVLWRTRKPRHSRAPEATDFRYRPSTESKFKAGLGLPDGGTDAPRSTRGTE